MNEFDKSSLCLRLEEKKLFKVTFESGIIIINNEAVS